MSAQQLAPPPQPQPGDIVAFILIAAVPLAVLALIGGIGYGLGSVAGENLAKRADELRTAASK